MKAQFLKLLPLLLTTVVYSLLFPHPAFAAEFVVNTQLDTIDAAPGNGICANASNDCSLRAAIMEANALNGDDTIRLGSFTYALSLTGAGEDDAKSGDLDIKAGGLTLIGAGNAGEAITSGINGFGMDRVLDLFKGSNVTLRRVTILGGFDGAALDSSFTNSQGGGGIRAWEANLTLDEVVLSENNSTSHGGAISFTMNPFGRPTPSRLTINNSTIQSNTATINGGGIAVGGAATVSINNSELLSNIAKSKSTSGISRYGGGALYIAQGYTPIGGDLLNTTVYITNTFVSNNLASDRNNNLISGNAWGGAIHMEFSIVSIVDTTFRDNIADGKDGGALYDNDGRLTVANSLFDGNMAMDEGGAIAANSVLYISVNSSTFFNNRTIDSTLGGGGAISGRGQENGGVFFVSNSLFENNQAIGSGGALLMGSNSTVVNSNFISNTSGANGGGIAILRSTIDSPAILNGVLVSDNLADVRGGGIHNGTVLHLSNSVISDNSTVQSDGGGISNYQAYALTITNTDILNNKAVGNGGGLFDSHLTQGSNNVFPHTTQLIDVIIDSNQAAGDGGGLQSLSTARLVNVTVSNNKAANSGGGILTYSAFQFSSERDQFPVNLDLINSTLSGNSAAEGGAIYQNGGVSKLNNVTIAGNSASAAKGGGGIYFEKDNPGDAINPNTITLNNTILAQNSASHGPDCANAVLSTGNNLLGNKTDCVFSMATADQVGTSLVPINPLLATLADNGGPTPTRALQSGSPAINMGNTTTCASSDQRGALRSGVCDIGAFEFGSTPKQTQTISFANPADKTLGDASFALSATATSGLTVIFATSTPAVCTVSGTAVTLVAEGTCTITASQAGNATFNAALQVTQSFIVAAKPVNSTKQIYLPLIRR